MIAAARRPASPYARRLARERGLSLASLIGSGPNGRVVAADVERAAKLPPAATLSTSTVTASSASAFAAAVDLQKLRALLAEFSAAQLPLTLDVMLLRAAGLALAAVPGANRLAGVASSAEPTPVAVCWEAGGSSTRREIVLSEPHNGLVSALNSRLAAGLAGDAGAPGEAAAALSVRRISHRGIRPSAMPLLPGYSMRVVVSAADDDHTADCLLCFDAQLVAEDDAATFLARFRDDLETPIRLLA